ncbi:MAG: BtpA/SgcQ family protein [Oscillospiraceae bacterium]
MNIVDRMRQGEKIIIGMVHCRALPGTQHYNGDMGAIIAAAVADAIALEQGGVDAVMVENSFDSPSAETLDTAQVAALAAIAREVRNSISLPLGVDAAFNDYKAGLAICVACGGSFIRCPVFVDTVVSGVGILSPCNRQATLYRKWLAAGSVAILADIQVKHAYMLQPEIPIEESAAWAVARGADAVIVTGASTGQQTPKEQLTRVKDAVSVPVVAGSGVDDETAAEQLAVAHGAIVGSFFMGGGYFENPVDMGRVKCLMRKVKN